MGTARAAALILLVSSFVSNPSAQRAGRASADRDLPISMRPATLGDQQSVELRDGVCFAIVRRLNSIRLLWM